MMHGSAQASDLDVKSARSDRAGEQSHWAVLAEPASVQGFHAAWLALLCQRLTGARAGLLALRNADGQFAPAALWPDAADLKGLAATAEAVINQKQAVVRLAEAGSDQRFLAGYPVQCLDDTAGAVVLALDDGQATQTVTIFREMHWAVSLVEAGLLRSRVKEAGEASSRLQTGFAALAATLDEDNLQSASFALVNELAIRLGASRVSVGMVKGSRVRLIGISNAAHFDRRAEFVAPLELAMEEAMIQRTEVRYPPSEGRRRQITIAHAAASTRLENACLISLPLLANGKVVSVVTLEWRQRDALPPELDDAARPGLHALMGTLAGPYLAVLNREYRWLSGRLPRAASNGLSAMFGRRRPGLKLALLSAAALIAAALTIQMPYRITARAVIEGEEQRAAVAPFDGFIARSLVRAGDTITANQDLAFLDDRELRAERAKWESEKQKLEQRQREAMAKFDRPNIQVIAAQLAQAEAELDIANRKLARTRITAPIDGYVVSGDLSQLVGSPVQQGKVLFEITPLNAYRVVIDVDEIDIRPVAPGQTGELTLTGKSGRPLPIELTRLTAVTTPRDGRNTFRTEARLIQTDPELRPGMEGVAKIEVGTASVARAWTRSFIDRVRLLIWAWTP